MEAKETAKPSLSLLKVRPTTSEVTFISLDKLFRRNHYNQQVQLTYHPIIHRAPINQTQLLDNHRKKRTLLHKRTIRWKT
jgi:hypothetical protein